MSLVGDIKKFKEFERQMEWEGGIEGIVRHGRDDTTGFSALDTLLEQMESILQEIDGTMDNIYTAYKTELDALEEEEENGFN